MATQKRFAGIRPNCAVLKPMMQRMMLLRPVTTHPCHIRLPINRVEMMVKTQER